MKNKVTVRKIAQKANVSPATVSRVVNHRSLVREATAKKVEEAMLALGFSPEQNIPAPVIHRPLVVIHVPAFHNAFYNDVIKGIQTSGKARGYQFLIFESPVDHGSLHDFQDLLMQVNAAGTILLGPFSEHQLEQIHTIAPLIQCCEYNENTDFPYVSVDDFSAAVTATEHLISCGRSKIALINGPAIFKYAIERQRGYINALNRAEISVLNNWIVHLPDINFEMAYASTCRLLNSDVRPDAFFAVSDVFAAAIIRAAKRFKLKVPGDIMVVGFDNIDLSQMTTPSITTINQYQFQQGYAACEMLIETIEHPETVQKPLLLTAELIVRESTRVL